ncbi:response regulator [Tardiphaga sp.]|jgi:DNA-binding NarL/FixJ family response regulator|uniref:response regulator n=1 Tax=Tardiphaga sp. TaxID=1926292 RepID=UPI00352B26B3
MERLLIADDHPLVRDGLRTVVEGAFPDCMIREATTLAEAMIAVEEDAELDLVLLDVTMPGTTGTAGLVALRQRFPTIPILLVSAVADRDLVNAALAAGAAGFVSKSAKRDAIVAAIRAVLAGEIVAPPEFTGAGYGDDHGEVWKRIDLLTAQQRRVLAELASGKLNKQIAYDLDISMRTVKAHVSAILLKLNVASRTQAVIMAEKVRLGTTQQAP